MPIAGSNRISFKAQVIDGRLTMARNELTMLPCLDPVDAMPLLLEGQAVRVNCSGPQRTQLMEMWEQQVGGATE